MITGRESTAAPVEWEAPLASRTLLGESGRVLADLEAKVADGGRISAEEALLLHDRADLVTLGRMADLRRRGLHPEPVVTYIVDRNINPTNVCIADCGFCAFFRPPRTPEAYVLPRAEIFRRVQETVDAGGQQLLMQGGTTPTSSRSGGRS